MNTPSVKNIPAESWRRAFVMLASLELGRLADWDGPSDFDELRMRVETLVLLFDLLSRTSTDLLNELIFQFSSDFSPGSIPSLAAMRTSARNLIASTHTEVSGNLAFQQAASILGMPADANVAASQVRNTVDWAEESNACIKMLARWLERVSDNDGPWNRLSLALADLPELRLDEVYVEVHAVRDEDVEESDDSGSERLKRVAGRITSDSHAVIDAATMVARTGEFCIVVGEPGSGKSTLAKWIVRQVSNRVIQDFGCAFVVGLGAIALWSTKYPELTLLELFFLEEGAALSELSAVQLLRHAAHEGRHLLLVLDGWDEVPEASRQRIQRLIQAERLNFKTILTSRPSGFPRRYFGLGRVETFQIAGLGREGRKELVSRYLSARAKQGMLQETLQRIESDAQLREIACNPFMLGLLAEILAQRSASVLFGRSISSLYQAAIELMVSQTGARDSRYPALLSQSLRTLEGLSYNLLFARHLPLYMFERTELLGRTSAACGEAVFQSRLVSQVDRLGTRFSFMHATIQEYFAARHFDDMTQDRLQQQLDQAFLSGSREIVLQFVCGLESNAGDRCRTRASDWMRGKDRFGNIANRVARLMIGCDRVRRPGTLMKQLEDQLWEMLIATNDLGQKEAAVQLFGRLNPVGLCERVHAVRLDDQFVLDCIVSSVPAAMVEASRIAELMNPAMRERVEAELLGAATNEAILASRQWLENAESTPDQVREAIVFAGSTRDQEAVPALARRLGEPGLPKSFQEEIATTLGLIGGREAADVLVNLVAGNMRASTVAMGLARRALRHTEDGHKRLNTTGRDALMRRLACLKTDQPSALRILSALCGFQIRAGLSLILHWYHSDATPLGVRMECLEIFDSTLGESQFDKLLGTIAEAPAMLQVRLLSMAIAHRRPISMAWLARRLGEVARLGEKTMLLTAALVVVSRSGDEQEKARSVLREVLRTALHNADAEHDDLAGAFQAALNGFDANHLAGHWVDRESCQAILTRFLDRDAGLHVDRVMLAASAVGWVRESWISELLCRSLSDCRARESGLMENQKKLLQEVARALCKSLADIDPPSLLRFPADWAPVEDVLRAKAAKRGWLVFDDVILDAEGRIIQPDWANAGEKTEAFQGAAWFAAKLGQPQATQEPIPIGNQQILPVIVSAVQAKLGVFRAAAFKAKLNNPSQLSRYLNGKSKYTPGAIRLAEAACEGKGYKLRLEAAKGLSLDQTVLEFVLRERGTLAAEMYELANVDEMMIPVSIERLDQPVFVCPLCSALNDPVDIDKEMAGFLKQFEAVLRPGHCIVCGSNSSADAQLTEFPDRPLYCPRCLGNFSAQQGEWSKARQRGECPSKGCQKADPVPRLSQMPTPDQIQTLQRSCRSRGEKPKSSQYFG